MLAPALVIAYGLPVYGARRTARLVRVWLQLAGSIVSGGTMHSTKSGARSIRHLLAGDFEQITAVVDEWWGGRAVRSMLPRLFFEHFNSTSFAIGEPGQVIAFLIGFISQSTPEMGYIHFVGVHPRHRGEGLGRRIYEEFFDEVSRSGCREVRCITSPSNVASIDFHRSMGFELLPGTGRIGSIPVSLDHAAPGEHRVRFRRYLAQR